MEELIEKLFIYAGRVLPEGSFKNLLRKPWLSFHYRYRNPLYGLDMVLARVELLTEGILLVEIKDGTKFFGLPDKDVHPAMKFGKPQKLGKIKEFHHFGDFFSMLSDEYMQDTYEKHYRIKENDTVVDIGANVGVFAIKAAKEVGNKGIVIAIEPERKSLSLLRRNIEQNKIGNVLIVSDGVWSQKTRLRFYPSPFISYNSFYKDAFYKTDDVNEFQEVEVDALDNILKGLGIKVVDFIKMDIEGSEVEALQGMEEILKRYINLVVEAHRTGGRNTAKGVIIKLKSKGFNITEEGIIYATKSKL